MGKRVLLGLACDLMTGGGRGTVLGNSGGRRARKGARQAENFK